jgi:O-6-methylguanine DNA methyltransferase
MSHTITTEAVLTTTLESPVGPLLAGATDEGICLLEFAAPSRQKAQLAALRRQFGSAIEPGRHELTDQLAEELAEYFGGARREFMVPLVLAGTPFQRRVWEQLRAIPYGETRSYADIARAVGSPAAVRAVGSANGKNRIAIVIPCHRVINKGGALGGYGGGLDRKRFLLDLERRAQ